MTVAPGPSYCHLSDRRAPRSQATEDLLFSQDPCAVSVAQGSSRLYFEVRLEIRIGSICCPEIAVRIETQNNHHLGSRAGVISETAYLATTLKSCGSVEPVATALEVPSLAPLFDRANNRLLQRLRSKIFTGTEESGFRCLVANVRADVGSRTSLWPC